MSVGGAGLEAAAKPTATDAGGFGPRLYTVAQVARLLQVSERTVQRRIKDGFLCKVPMPGRLVRISHEELEKLLEK